MYTERENERTRSLPLSPSSRPSIFFLCVNFFPALCYLNAWNRLVERIWEGGGGGYFWQFLVLLTLFSDQKMSQLAYFSFFLTHLSKKDSKNSRSARSCPKRHMPIWLQKGSTPPSLGGKNTGVFLKKSRFCPVLGNSRQSYLVSTPGILYSVIFVSGTWIPYRNRLWDSSFLELYSGFQSSE